MGLVARAAGPVAQDAPLIMSGVVTAADGQPVANAAVRVDLEPSKAETNSTEGAGVELVRLGEVRTNKDGEFAVKSADLGDMTGYVESDGTASLLVTSFGPFATIYQHLLVKPSNKKGTVWTMAVEDSVAVDKRKKSSEIGAALRTGYARTAPGAAPIEVSLKSKRERPAVRKGYGFGVDGSYYCAGSYYWERSTASGVIKEHVRVNRAYVKTKVKWVYDWQNSSTTQVDASANLGSGGALVQAGFVSIQTTSAGVSSVADGNTQMDARREYNFYPYRLYCSNYSGGFTYAGIYEWRPYSWTGGSAFGTLNTAIFNCNSAYIASLGGPTWSSVDKTLQFSAGATVGASLRSSQTHNSSHKLTLSPRAAGAQVCGYNADFINAPQVREP